MTQLLEQNYLILSQYKQNMQQYKVNENTGLLVQFRDNILTILNQMSCMTGLMQHMPDLPVRLNEDLANSFLPKASSTLYGASSQAVLPCESMPLHPGTAVCPITLHICFRLKLIKVIKYDRDRHPILIVGP